MSPRWTESLDGSRPRPTVPDRFWALVDRTSADGCWPWRTGRRYGQFWLNGTRVKSHRFAYELTHGPIPAGMEVCHRCDNPPCCRPDHLFIGTRSDNMVDGVRKGRFSITKLTVDDIQTIRASRLSKVVLARLYGVSPAAIRAVQIRRSWAHVA